MPLSRYDLGDRFQLVDEGGNVIQEVAKAGLKPATVEAYNQYPEVPPERMTTPGQFLPEQPPNQSLAYSLGQGLRSAGQDISNTLGGIGSAVAKPFAEAGKAGNQFMQGLGVDTTPQHPLQKIINQQSQGLAGIPGGGYQFQQPGITPAAFGGGSVSMEIPGAVDTNQEKAQGLLDTGVGLQLAGLSGQGQAEQKGLGYQMGALQAVADVANRQKEAAEAEVNQFQTDYNAFKAQQDERIKKLEETPPEKTYGQWFSEKSTAGKILWGIAIGAATVASLTKAGGNALSFIDRVIGQDLQAQNSQYAKAKTLVEAGNTRLGQLMQYHGDRRAALTESALGAYKWAAAQVDMAAAKTQSAALKSKYDLMKGQLLERASGLQRDLDSHYVNLAKMKADMKGLDPEKMIQGLGYAKFGTKEEVKNLRDTFITATTGITGVDNLISMANMSNLKRLAPIERQKLQGQARVEIQALTGALRLPFFGPGILTPSEQEKMDKILRDPTKIFNIDAATVATLNKVKDVLNRGVATRAATHGIEGFTTPNEKPPGAITQVK